MAITITDNGLQLLQIWLSPNFPVGAFAYSHGLENAVEIGTVRNGTDLSTWLEGLLQFGNGRADAALLRRTFQAVTDNDVALFLDTAALAAALRGSSELAQESSLQGRAFWHMLSAIWPAPALAQWHQRLVDNHHTPAYVVAVGTAAALAEIPLRATLLAYLNAFVANLIAAATRLMSLGQTEAQQIMAKLIPHLSDTVSAALQRPLDDVASTALMVDWCSMNHETQYSRLFRS